MIQDEEWYIEQGKRWRILEKAGWTFNKVPTNEDYVGLGMIRFDLPSGDLENGQVVQVPKKLGFKQIQTQILESCEEYHKKFIENKK